MDPMLVAVLLTAITKTEVCKKLIEVTLGKVAEKMTEEAIVKTGELRKMLFDKLRGNQAAEEAFAKAEASGSEDDLQDLAAYVNIAVKEDETFAVEVQSLTEEITSLIRSPTLTIKPNKATAHYYTETLSPGVDMEMALILGGEFQMGSPEDEEEHQDNEKLHPVTVLTFFMGRTPVTQAQWKSIAQLPKIQIDLNPNPSHFKGDDNLPVESVSWEDTIEFCDRLSLHTGRTYKLPSEAQWEYACRAGTNTPFYFGETIDAELANYQAEDEELGDTVYPRKYGRGRFGEDRKKTTPVKTFEPNAWGLYDMHGNVWELCQDDHENYYKKIPKDGTPHLVGSDWKVLRGGSWFEDPGHCRSACRDASTCASRNDFIGFRVVSSASKILP